MTQSNSVQIRLADSSAENVSAQNGRPNSPVRPLKIGGVTLKNNLILAPMAGYGDVAFRRVCREYGAGLTVTEMISAKGLVYGSDKTEEMLRLDPTETPSSLQLFGSDPEVFRAVFERGFAERFDIVDVNMGCPVHKVTKNGEGSALLDAPDLAARIVETCVKYSRKPVSVKIRIGRTDEKINALPFARLMERAGASLVAVHGRTASQMYRGKANWDVIGEVAAALSVPVVGNGDITTAAECYDRLSRYPVAGVMIGRGALGRPDLFSDVLGGEGNRLLDVILHHLDCMLDYFPPRYTAINFRKHLACYLKGVPGGRDLRGRLAEIEDVDALRAELIRTFTP